MPQQYTIPLNELISGATDGQTSELSELMSDIGLSELTTRTDRSPPVADLAAPEWDVGQNTVEETFDHGPEQPPPPLPDLSHMTVEVEEPGGAAEITSSLEVYTELAFDIPALPGVTVVLNPGGIDPVLTLDGQDTTLELTAGLSLRFAPDLLQPVTKVTDDSGSVSFEPDKSRDYAAVALGEVEVTIHVDGPPQFETEVGAELDGPVEVGETGVIIESADLEVNFSGDGPAPDVAPDHWTGVMLKQASIRLPDLFDGTIETDGLGFGAGGITGSVSFTPDPNEVQYDPDTKTYSGDFGGTFLGLKGAVTGVSLEFQQNVPVGGGIQGEVIVPYFEERVAVDVSISAETGFSVTVTDAPDDSTDAGSASNSPALVELKREGVYRITVESIGITIDDGTEVSVSGTVTPDIDDLDLPGVRIEELSVDDDGNVQVEGGWIDLKEQYSVDFHGFTFEVTKLGFGSNDDGSRWIGLNGSIKFVDELSAGASVEGLRITWDDDGVRGVSFDGIGIEFEVPGVIEFEGEVGYTEDDGVHRFDGDISVDLISLDITVDGSVVVGTKEDFTFFAVYLEGQLTSGIPLWATGLSLYGMAGLYAGKMSPGKEATPGTDELAWYDADNEDRSWYHKGEPGVSDLEPKWGPDRDGMAFGAGVVVGTTPDNGYSFNSRLLLVISFPGPVIMLNGRANLLKERSELSDEGMFGAIAVLDNRAGTFTAGLDAQYMQPGNDQPASGGLVDVRGSAEAFYDFQDPTAWYLNIGRKEPRKERIRADFLSLFTADAYLMMDPQRLALGGRYGYDANYGFGPLSVDLEAWIEANAAISWYPVHFTGELWLHGRVALQAFGFGLGITADARIAAEVLDPFHLVGEFSVSLSLPWPLDDVGASVTLEWGPELDDPPIPHPLKEVGIEHQKTTTGWPLPRSVDDGSYSLLLPDYGDPDLDGMLAPAGELPDVDTSGDVSEPDGAPPIEDMPVVPLDGRPYLSFNRPVRDEIDVDGKDLDDPGWEQIGNPGEGTGPVEVRYTLDGLTLLEGVPQDEDDGSISWSAFDSTDGPGGTLHGTWAPLPTRSQGSDGTRPSGDKPLGNTKLWLYTESPFAYARHAGGESPEYVDRDTVDYPCPPEPVCYDCVGVDPLDLETRDEVIRRTAEVGGTETEYVAEQNYHTYRTDEAWPAFTVDHEGDARRPELKSAGETGADVPVLRFYSDHHGDPIEDMEWKWAASKRLELTIDLPYEYRSVAVAVRPDPDTYSIECSATDGGGVTHDETVNFDGQNRVDHRFVLTSDDSTFDTVTLVARRGTKYPDSRADDPDINWTPPILDLDVVEVCGGHVPLDEPRASSKAVSRARQSVSRWAETGRVLRPNRVYRLQIDTTVEARGTEGFEFERTESLSEFAYFRTGGPPGVGELSAPVGASEPEEFTSGLGDLERYVRSTTPETVGVRGSSPPGPFYRAYDVDVAFNEDYVDRMYREASRDLGLYLYDANDRPVRDASGRLTVTQDAWGTVEELVLDRDERRWLETIESRDCLSGATSESEIAEDDLLETGSTADGELVLDPETTYEARLVPMPLNDRFTESLDAWASTGSDDADWSATAHGEFDGSGATVVSRGAESTVELQGLGAPGSLIPGADVVHFAGDSARQSGRYAVVGVDGGASPPTVTVRGEPSLDGGSDWTIPERGVATQTGSIGDSATTLGFEGDPGLTDGDPLHPSSWTDYRVETVLRNENGTGEVGLVVREHYEVVLDYDDGSCRLGPVDGEALGTADELDLTTGRDYRLTVEVIDASLRVYLDGERLLTIDDDSVESGGVGLRCTGTDGARFNELRVDDFGETVPAAYAFSFTTSRFADFGHQVHSYQDETWGADLPASASSALSAARDPSTDPNADEARAYEDLVDELNVSAGVDSLDVTRIGDGTNRALLVRSPEPIDWANTDLSLHRGPAGLELGTPGRVKLTRATLGSGERVRLMARESLDLSGHRVEYRTPDVSHEGETLLAETFEDASAWTFPHGSLGGTDGWTLEDGVLRHQRDGSGGGSGPVPGTVALTGEPSWQDYRIDAAFTFDSDGSGGTHNAAGIVFRCQGPDHLYRFTADTTGARLARKDGGRSHVLWQETGTVQTGQEHEITVVCVGARIVGLFDGQPMFDIVDEELSAGRVGVYCRENVEASFDTFVVQQAEWRWEEFHEFGDRDPVPAGTEIELHGGTERTSRAGLHEWPLDPDNQTPPRLSPWKAHLRVLGPDGSVIHDRQFRASGQYTRKPNVGVLRNADGTGAIVTTGPSLDRGQYRLELEYDRDGADRSHNGSTAPELALIDIPWETQ